MTKFFNRWGILYCEELTKKSDEWLKSELGKKGVELKHELLGEYIWRVKNNPKPPKSIQNTRTFPEFTSDLNYIKNWLNIHIHNSCRKLRKINGVCNSIGVILKTKDFKYFYDKKILENPTDFELEISEQAFKILEKLYDKNIVYRSCGIVLENLDFSKGEQLTIFADTEKIRKSKNLAKSIDKLEQKFGKNIVKTGFVEK